MLNQKLSARLKELGMTQTELAEKSNLTSASISKYIRGKAFPTYDNLVILSKILKVHPGYFFSEETSQPSVSSSRFQVTIPNPDPKVADTLAFPSPSGKFVRGGSFVIGHLFPMSEVPPPTQIFMHGALLNFYSLIFNTLAQWLPDGRSGRFRGVLARDWKPMEEESSWIFQLREDVRFHNGKRLAVEDIIWSYEQYLLKNPDERHIDGIEAFDRNFIQLHLNAPCRLEEIRMPFIVPFGTRENPEEWIGTGPFQLIELTSNLWRLRRNPHYFFGQPKFDFVEIRHYPSEQALTEALARGQVHFAIGINYPEEGFIVQPEASFLRYHLHFMVQEELGQNPLLRRAIHFALDRKALAKVAGLQAPRYAAGPFDYFLGDYTPQPQPPDRETAKLLVQQVFRSAESHDKVFRIQFYQSAPKSGLLASAIVKQLNEIGIPTEIGDPPDAIVALRPADHLQLEYDMWKTGTAVNLSRYSNPEVNRCIEAYQNDLVSDAQLLELRGLIQSDMPDIPLFYNEEFLTYAKSLRAVENRIILLSGLNDIHNWYFEAERQYEEVTKPRAMSAGM
jgi:ABC-type transport system substrate-binding protein